MDCLDEPTKNPMRVIMNGDGSISAMEWTGKNHDVICSFLDVSDIAETGCHQLVLCFRNGTRFVERGEFIYREEAKDLHEPKCTPEEFRRAWADYQNNRGKTRTLAGVYLMAVLAEKEEPGCAAQFMEAWKARHDGTH